MSLQVGKFQHQSTLRIHTKQAQQLIIAHSASAATTSKKTYLIIGLQKFCLSVRNIWKHVRLDDPYADMILIEIERRIENAFVLLNRLNREIDNNLSEQLPGITLDIYQSNHPATITLSSTLYSTTHANLGARLIGLFDLLCRKLKTGISFGMINREQYNGYKYKATKAMRGVFSAPLLYKQTGVNRHDIINQTDKGLATIQQLGPVPENILTGTITTRYGPTSKNQHQHANPAKANSAKVV